jgi:hypothetical protein
MQLSRRNKSVRSYIKRVDKEGGEEEIGKLVKWGVVKVEGRDRGRGRGGTGVKGMRKNGVCRTVMGFPVHGTSRKKPSAFIF